MYVKRKEKEKEEKNKLAQKFINGGMRWSDYVMTGKCEAEPGYLHYGVHTGVLPWVLGQRDGYIDSNYSVTLYKCI